MAGTGFADLNQLFYFQYVSCFLGFAIGFQNWIFIGNFVGMTCKDVLFSDHAITQMFKRNISIDQVKRVIESGERIAEYPTDKPYPSCLMFAYIGNRPICSSRKRRRRKPVYYYHSL
ncbi:MAG: DUF4258 domain-containing protein [Sphingobacteriales bacterium]|nr:DUF4258 domain-containing protein [Sphingobacteriales bacterium]